MAVPSALRARLDAAKVAAAPPVVASGQDATGATPAPTPPLHAPPPPNVIPMSPIPLDMDFSKLDDTQFLEVFGSGAPAAPAAPDPAQPAQPAQPAHPTGPSPVSPSPVAQPSASDPEVLIQLGRLQAENERLRQSTTPAPTPTPAAPPPPLLNLVVENLTPEEQQTYGAAAPVIRKLAASLLQESTRPLLDEIASLRAQVTETQATTTRQLSATAGRAFQTSVATRIPNIRAVFDDPKFRQFQSKSAPLTGGTYGDVLRSAWDSQDLSRVEEVISAYNREHVSAPAVPDPTSFAQPNASPAPAAPRTETVLLGSKLSAASNAFRKGRISRDDMARIRGMYDRAEREGRVDYSR